MLKFREHDLRRNRKKMPNSTLKKYLIKSTHSTGELTIFKESKYLNVFRHIQRHGKENICTMAQTKIKYYFPVMYICINVSSDCGTWLILIFRRGENCRCHFLILILEYGCLCVRVRHEKTPTANTLSNHQRVGHSAWAPEGREGRSQRPKGPPARSRGPEGPRTSSWI